MDYSTSYIFLLVSLGLFTLVLFTLSLVDRSVVGARWLAASTLLDFSKTLLQEFNGHLPRIVTVCIANELNVCAFLAMFFGLRWFVVRKSFHGWLWLSSVFIVLAIYPVLFLHQVRQWSFSVISLPVVGICAATIWMLARQSDELFTVPSRLVAVLMTVQIFAVGFRMALSVLGYPKVPASPWSDERWMYSMLIIILVGYCMLLMYALFTVIEMHSRVAYAAGVDALTGALNRRALMKHGTAEVARSQRLGHPLAAICIDLDNFKRVNDTHGHDGGDVALCAFVDLAREHLRTGDIIARTGGEEFIVLLPGMDAAGAAHVAERLRHSMEQMRIHYDGRMIMATASAGVTLLQQDDSLAMLLKRADQSLYRAKAEGRNRVVLDEEIFLQPKPILVERLTSQRKQNGKTA